MKIRDDQAVGTLRVREEARPEQLGRELRDAITAAQAAGKFEALRICHETRRCLWPDQQADGRHPDPRGRVKSVFRWEGAPDLRVPMADEMVRKLALVRKQVLARGEVHVAPRLVPGARAAGPEGESLPEAVTEDRRLDLAGVWQTTLEHFLHTEQWSLRKAWELFSTCVEEFGYAGLMPGWRKLRRMELRKVSTQELTDYMVQRERQALLAALAVDAEAVGAEPLVELSPEAEAGLVETVRVQLEELLMTSPAVEPAAVELLRGYDPDMSEREARHVLAQLRRNGNEPASYQAPREEGGKPVTEVLIPWINWIHPHDMGGDGETMWTAMPEYLDEVELEVRARVEGWNKASLKWLKETQRNKLFENVYSDLALPGWAMNGVGVGLVPCEEALVTMPRWLVITQWRRVVDENGLPRVVKLVFHPAMTDEQKLLLWEETDCEELPLVVDTAEEVLYAMQARGVPEIVVDKQNYVKDSLDNEGARGQLGSNPPLLRTAKEHVGVRPGIEMYAARSGTSFSGSQFMEVPSVDSGTLQLIDRVQAMVRRYYFCDATTAPEDKEMFYNDKADAAQLGLSRWMRLLWKLIQENVDELQVGRIAGRPVRLEVNRDQLQGEADVTISFFSGAFKEGAAENFIEVLTKALQVDRGGRIDTAEALQVAMQLLSPSHARRLVLGGDVAQGRNREDERQRISQIMAGVPVEYFETVPGVQDRIAELNAWLSNPYNVQRLQAAPDVAAAMERERQYLEFHLNQQVVNPVVGRTGVKG